MGRKLKKDPKSKIISVSCTQEEYDRILSMLPENMNLSTYGRLKMLSELK